MGVTTADGFQPLGDILARSLDAERRAHLARSLEGPVGRAAVLRGLATPADLSAALRTQMRLRLGRWLHEEVREIRFETSSVPKFPFEDPPDTHDLLLCCMRRAMATRGPPSNMELDAMLGRELALSAGAEVLSSASLPPHEMAMWHLLQRHRSVRGEALVRAAGHHPAALHGLHIWRLMGWVVAAALRRGDHSVLLRKAHQLRRNATDGELLDVPGHASQSARRAALRRLVARVHPDRFDDELTDASGHVLRALIEASSH